MSLDYRFDITIGAMGEGSRVHSASSVKLISRYRVASFCILPSCHASYCCFDAFQALYHARPNLVHRAYRMSGFPTFHRQDLRFASSPPVIFDGRVWLRPAVRASHQLSSSNARGSRLYWFIRPLTFTRCYALLSSAFSLIRHFIFQSYTS